MDCDDSTRQIGDSTIGPTRAFNNCGERPLIGPGLDRLRQIDIGIGIGGELAGYPWQGTHQVIGINGTKGTESWG